MKILRNDWDEGRSSALQRHPPPWLASAHESNQFHFNQLDFNTPTRSKENTEELPNYESGLPSLISAIQFKWGGVGWAGGGGGMRRDFWGGSRRIIEVHHSWMGKVALELWLIVGQLQWPPTWTDNLWRTSPSDSSLSKTKKQLSFTCIGTSNSMS